jgi:hypothetical protein
MPAFPRDLEPQCIEHLCHFLDNRNVEQLIRHTHITVGPTRKRPICEQILYNNQSALETIELRSLEGRWAGYFCA